MNIHYNINTVIYNKDKDKYYITTLNNSPKVVCSYENDSWCYVDNYDENKTSSEINELNEILMLDINTIFIKNQFLDSLSKYKLKDLEELSKKEDISLHKNGKKKIKKELYDEINLKHYIQDI